jgi:hypothetical protein
MQTQAATRFFVGDIMDRPGFLASQVAGASSVELLVDSLLLQRLPQPLVLRDGHLGAPLTRVTAQPLLQIVATEALSAILKDYVLAGAPGGTRTPDRLLRWHG